MTYELHQSNRSRQQFRDLSSLMIVKVREFNSLRSVYVCHNTTFDQQIKVKRLDNIHPNSS